MANVERDQNSPLDHPEETPLSLYNLIQQVLTTHAERTDPLYFAFPGSYAEWEAEERKYREMEDAEGEESE